MKSSKNIICIWSIVVLCLAFTACSKMDASYDEYIQGGEIVYASSPDSIKAHAGNKRIKLSLHYAPDTDPKLSKVKVYWNFRADSATIPVQTTAGQRVVDIAINNMPKGAYTFELYTYNKEGKPSIKHQVAASVYDDEFGQSRQTDVLPLKYPVKLVEDYAMIEWFPAAYVAGVEVKYTDVANVARTVKVTGASIYSIKVPGAKPGSTLQYRGLYLPDNLALDTAYAAYVSATVPAISQLDKGKFAVYRNSTDNLLAGDATNFFTSAASGNMTWERMWDDKYGEFDGYQSAGQALPQSFTIDLGVTKKIGSFRYFMRGINGVNEPAYLYNNANPKTWEIWGRADTPNPDGSYTGWTKLGTATPYTAPNKPATITDADRALANAGLYFTIPAPFNNIPVRYLRWKTLTNYGNTANTVVIQELAFYEK